MASAPWRDPLARPAWKPSHGIPTCRSCGKTMRRRGGGAPPQCANRNCSGGMRL